MTKLQQDSNTGLSSADFPGGKVGLLALGLFCGMYLIKLPFWIVEDYNKLDSLNDYPAAISIKITALPLLTGVPMIAAIILSIIKCWRGRHTRTDSNRIIKTACINTPVLFLTIFINHWQVTSTLIDQGYEKCRPLTGGSQHAPWVWVRAPEYCVIGFYDVSYKLVKWTEEQAKLGYDLSPADMIDKANALMLERGL